MEALTRHLAERGLLSSADVDRVLDLLGRTGGNLPSAIVRLGLIDEDQIALSVAEVGSWPLYDANAVAFSSPLMEGINHRYLSRHSILPLRTEQDHLYVAMADPADQDTIEALTFATGLAIQPAVATFSVIEAALTQLRPEEAEMRPEADITYGAQDDLERMLEGDSEAPVIRTVQRMLTEAVNRRASDVHIEPMDRYVAIRFRIDGRLIEAERIPDTLSRPIASRIKVMASLDIAESRLPQDGRLRLNVRGREVDVRVSTSPTAWGESIVLRLLGRSEVPLDLDRLGLPPAALTKLHRALDRPHGILLLTGPTGSGKTTTLYAAVSHLRRPEVKILTVEDPVEILIEGVNQVQVRPEIDLSYAATLRAFLRQDPDILMIGEIRDQETAEIAMRAALTGHLVLSTLHTNSALGAFARLADIGVEPYLTASTVIATIAQRLIRALCKECRVVRGVTDDEAQQFRNAGIEIPDQVYEPAQCGACSNSGYRGRVPLIEIIEPDDALRERIRLNRVDEADDQRDPAETLYGHGLALIAAGTTTFAEVQRAVHLQ